MFDDVLIESGAIDRKRGGWLTPLISTVIHVGFISAVIAAGHYFHANPEIIEKPIAAFIVASPAPPPPPAPPPASSNASTPIQKRETPKEQPKFSEPRDTPQDVPVVSDTKTKDDAGGVVGGKKGGVVGGTVGGEVGGQFGGVVGGKIGGVIGGTGDSPFRVGGNVLAPVAVVRVEPAYTEMARKARIQGTVIVEAIIDSHGDVIDARIMKGLPFGLEQEALRAIRRWKFKPGTHNGQPVPVYFNLRIEFKLN